MHMISMHFSNDHNHWSSRNRRRIGTPPSDSTRPPPYSTSGPPSYTSDTGNTEYTIHNLFTLKYYKQKYLHYDFIVPFQKSNIKMGGACLSICLSLSELGSQKLLARSTNLKLYRRFRYLPGMMPIYFKPSCSGVFYQLRT